jgi:myo-inositol-1(or 4)-monophosphatase
MTSRLNESSLSFAAIQAALSAGNLLKRGFGTSYGVSSKEGKQNLVTEYDHASEELIFKYLKQQFPDHGILSEESHPKMLEEKEVLWIIDPLDGTVNFAHHIPVFSVSIAAAINNEIVCGVIYQPMTEELFTAERKKGAFLNGTRLKVSTNHQFDMAMMATGFPYNVDKNPLHCIDFFAHMTSLGLPIRRLGSAAIDLAYVAAGRFDGYWEVTLHPWDMAAGKLLVEEAGGKVTRYDGSIHTLFEEQSVLATNGHLHAKIISELKKFIKT